MVGWHPTMRFALLLACCACLASLTGADLEATWVKRVQPLLSQYCYDCHDTDTSKGDIDLEVIRRPADLAQAGNLVQGLLHALEHEEMPPRKAKKQPTAEERAELIAWIRTWQVETAKAHADDPGLVVMPRLSREEFAWVVRDLAGVPTMAHEQIPGDGGAGEGFTNVGQAQTMTTDQVDAYLAAARGLLLQARFVPGEPVYWSAGSMQEAPTAADQRRQLVSLWGDWYRGQMAVQRDRQAKAVKDAGYRSVIAAYIHAALLVRDGAEPAAVATTMQPPLMPGVVQRIADWLAEESANPVRQQIRERFRALPRSQDAQASRQAAEDLARWLDARSDDAAWGADLAKIEPYNNYGKIVRKKIDDGEWNYDLDLTQDQQGKLYLAVSDCEDPSGDVLRWHQGRVTVDGKEQPWQAVGRLTDETGAAVPWGADGSVVVRAPSVLILDLPATATALSCQAIADSSAGTEACMQTLIDTAAPDDRRWFLRRRLLGPKGIRSPGVKAAYEDMAEVRNALFDPHRDIRWKDPYCLTDYAAVAGADLDWSRLGVAPDPKARNFSVWTPTPPELRAQAHETAQADLRRIATLLRASLTDEPSADLTSSARTHLLDLVGRCWRRPPTDAELADLLGLFAAQRANGTSYEAAVESACLAVLLSPHFLYRAQQVVADRAVQPLSGTEVADRMAFAIWGSIPDAELLDLARSGRLDDPAVLRAQVIRMIQDPRSQALADRFLGQWLGFAGFDTFSGPDQERFKAFTPDLRAAMHQECEHFALDLFRSNRPVTVCLDATWTFANEVLAQHYGIPGVKGREFRRVDQPGGRQGMLTMAAFLTKTSTPLRTSPVKRGAWVYENLLGVHLPPPPPVVPRLSDDERNDEGMPIRDQLARHREDAACSTCHDKIDPLGIALERFDPIGRFRDKDLSGVSIPAKDTLADGTVLDGVQGLADWLKREDQRRTFTRAFARKLLGYCLGRTVEVTDEPLLERLTGSGAIGAADLLAEIVASPQFRHRRNVPLFTPEHP